MTFIDVSAGRPSTGLIVGYSVLCAVSVFCAGWAVHLGRSRFHYHSFFSVRVLFPLALFILALENAALATSGLFYSQLEKEGDGENYESFVFYDVVFVLQAFEVPILLIVIFEITYLVHKRRSVNFCGMSFDEGVRVKNTAFMSCMLRNCIRALATVLLVMGLIVNLDLLQSGTPVDELAGRAGWWALGGEDWDGKVHLLLSLIPTAILILVSFYLSIMLWRYGTESSMVVHSSIANPWFYPMFGTVAMAVGQLFGEELYTVMSNTGVLIFIITILLLMAEVDKDIVATNDVASFLVQVAQKGDQIRVEENVAAPPSLQSSDEEENRPDDEEVGPAALAETGASTSVFQAVSNFVHVDMEGGRSEETEGQSSGVGAVSNVHADSADENAPKHVKFVDADGQNALSDSVFQAVVKGALDEEKGLSEEVPSSPSSKEIES
ncbi:hypothetical protein ACHAXT_007868 [Thalassiosira profunda]